MKTKRAHTGVPLGRENLHSLAFYVASSLYDETGFKLSKGQRHGHPYSGHRAKIMLRGDLGLEGTIVNTGISTTKTLRFGKNLHLTFIPKSILKMRTCSALVLLAVTVDSGIT